MSKPPMPSFLPSPRPRPHTRPEDARQLAAATSDLGFTRASSAPPAAPAAPDVPRAPPAADPPETQPARRTRSRASARRRAKVPTTALKVDVEDPIWTALRQEALDRRVTVKYLILEALAAKGYPIDLATVPKDGRRLR